MRHYESIIIVHPAATGEDELSKIIDKYTSVITSHEGSLAKIDKWGMRKLAYPIRKEIQAYYLYLEFGCTPQGVKEMERQLRIDDRILKYLTVKLGDEFDPSASKEEEPAAEESAAETPSTETA